MELRLLLSIFRKQLSLPRESGQALILAVIVMAALTISTAGLVTYATANERSFARDTQATRALGVAEAGLQSAAGVIAAQDPKNKSAVGTRLPASGTYSQSIDGGTATYYVQKSADKLWVAYSTGTSVAGNVSRQVLANIQDVPIPTPYSPLYSYKFFVVGTPGTCTVTSGSTAITGSVWIGGDFCPSGGASILEPGSGHTQSVYIGGQYKPTGGATIGTAAAPVKTASIMGGCPAVSSPAGDCSVTTGGHPSQVYADDYTKTASALTKLPIDTTKLYAAGAWNSPSCTGAGSFVFDNDAIPGNNSRGSVSNLLSSSFDCTIYKPGTTTVEGKLAFNATSNPKVLTISGTVFIDGDLSFSSGAIQYAGNGTLYANGKFNSSSTQVCGPPATPGNNNCTGTAGKSWDSSLASMEIVALNTNNASPAFNMSGSGQLDLTAWANGFYSQSGGSSVSGPVIADTATISGGSTVNVPTVAPDGAPGGPTDNWNLQPGSWRQVH